MSGTDTAGAAGDGRPVLRVISGNATPEEIAVILALISARSGAGGAPAPAQTSTWADHGYGQRGVRARFSRGQDGWRTSYWPR